MRIAPSSAPLPAPAATPTAPQGADGFGARIAALAARIDGGERALDAALARLRRGPAAADGGLLALQAAVYRYGHDVQLASKVVDAAVDGVKRVLDAQR